MKVVYRSMLKEIERAVETAATNNRVIEHIEVTPVEHHELMTEMLSYNPTDSWVAGDRDALLVHGVKIKRNSDRSMK